MSIKMKDDFELPVKKTPGGVMPFLKDAAGDVIFVGSDKHVDATAIAINAYDANQQEISELKAMVNVLRRAADLYHGGYKASELEEAAAIMNMSPAQCLKSVKADAVKEFGHEIGLYDSEYDDQEYIEVSRYSLREHIEQLCEGKS